MLEADSAECSPWVEGRFCRMATRSGGSRVAHVLRKVGLLQKKTKRRGGLVQSGDVLLGQKGDPVSLKTTVSSMQLRKRASYAPVYPAST